MEELRWLLLAAGVVVIVAIYFYSRREASRPKADPEAAPERVEPRLELDQVPGDDVIDDESADSRADDEESPEATGDDAVSLKDAPSKIVTLRVVARERGSFRGDELILCLRGIGLRHGKFGIFHRYDGDNEAATIFSAASLVEPGSFDLSNIKDQQIPGISLFAVLPGPVAGVEAFDLMIAAAKAIAQSLDAELLDESGSTLSIQRERYLREEIIQFEHAGQVGSQEPANRR